MSEQGSHIGTLIKPHGYKGDLQMKGNSHLLDNIQIGDPLFISIDGQRIPFFVTDLFESGRNDRIVVKFEFIDGIDEARKFTNCDVFSERLDESSSPGDHELSTQDDLDISSMMNFHVHDKNSGKRAVVIDFVKSSENPILILKIEKQEIMLPLNADYIESIDHESKQIIANFPDGLFEL